jgi:hypothetical protein
METHDLNRKKITRDLPTHPPDPALAGDEEKIVNDGGAVRSKDYNDPPPKDGAKSTGAPLDEEAGGPVLGQAPSADNAAGRRDADVRADDIPPCN